MQTNPKVCTEFRRKIASKPVVSLPPQSSSTPAPALDSSLVMSDVNEFADLYHPAVRAFIGSIVRNSTAANEMTQAFFVEVVVQGHLLRRTDSSRSGFHEYLKQAARHFVIDERRFHARKKRRPAERDSLSSDRSSEWDGTIRPASPEQDSAFLRGLTQGIVWAALRQVSDTCKQKGRQQHFRLFVGRFLAPAEEMPNWRALAEPFALDEKTARSRAETVARQVRVAIRQLVANEWGSSKSLDEEIRDLICLF